MVYKYNVRCVKIAGISQSISHSENPEASKVYQAFHVEQDYFVQLIKTFAKRIS